MSIKLSGYCNSCGEYIEELQEDTFGRLICEYCLYC